MIEALREPGQPYPAAGRANLAIRAAEENGVQDSCGAGVGLFAGGSGNKVYANVVIGNRLIGNGLPGVALHNHASPAGAPAFNLNDNVIVGNYIARNRADTQDAATRPSMWRPIHRATCSFI